VPVILRPCAWHEAPFSRLQAVPRDGRPVTRWDDRDEACLDVANGVMKVVDELISGVDSRISERVQAPRKRTKKSVSPASGLKRRRRPHQVSNRAPKKTKAHRPGRR
jgi:hypothetical protein